MSTSSTNFSSNVILSDQKSRWQSAYYSQLYGTFFGVFVKFVTNHDSSHACKLNSIKFKLINYKGIIDLGISKVGIPRIIDVEDNEGNYFKSLYIKLEVQAMHRETETLDKDCSSLEFPDPDKDIFLFIDRRVKPMHIGRNELNYGVFDSEFYYREGIGEPIPIEGELKPKEWCDDYEELDGNILKDKDGGGICPKGISKIHSN